MRITRLFLFERESGLVVFVLLLAAAGKVAWCQDAFVRSDAGSGALIEKLIVVKSGVDFEPHPDSELQKDTEPPKPFSIFWRLKTGTPGDEKDGMYLAGSPEGDPVCWISKEHVQPWRTRMALDPILPDEKGVAFTVYKDEGARTKLMEFIGDAGKVPKGHQRFAMITAPSDDEDGEEAGMVFPITAFTGEIEARAGGGGVKQQAAMDISNLEFEVIFVIDTTGSMEPLVEMAKGVIAEVVVELSRGGGRNVRDAVRFGLVQYRDEGDEFVSDVTLPLDTDPVKLSSALASVFCEGGGDAPEAVTAGLKAAIDEGGWNKNSSKHIILLGDAQNKDGTGPTIEDIVKQANKAGGSSQQEALAAVMIHAVASYQGVLDATVREQFQELTRGDKTGFFGTMERDSAADASAVTTELISFLKTSLGILEEIRATGELKEDSSVTGAEVAARASFYRIYATSTSAGDKHLHDGFARAYDEKGNRVATQKILVMRGELRRLWSGLDNLLVQFKRLKKGRGNIKTIIDQLRSSVAGTATGDRLEITDSTTLAEIVGKDLPMKTNALRVSIADVAIMESEDFDAFIATLESARKRAEELHDDAEQWSTVNDFMESSADAAFLELSDLP